MWGAFLAGSLLSIGVSIVLAVLLSRWMRIRGKTLRVFHCLFAGAAVAAFVMFWPVNADSAPNSALGNTQTLALTVLDTIEVFTMGTSFSEVQQATAQCAEPLATLYRTWAAVFFMLAPLFTFGMILSFFKNITAYLQYLRSYFADVYIFSELNEKSLFLAKDLKAHNKKRVVVFTGCFDDKNEADDSLLEGARAIGAVCFQKDMSHIHFRLHSAKRELYFYTISVDEQKNLDYGLQLISHYHDREHTHLYICSTKIGSELLLASADKGAVKVRRINEVQSLINRVLYEDGARLFETAMPGADGLKDICAVIVGMGHHGKEMAKSLSWYCQMDGYRVELHGFDRDPLALDTFTALAPELMSEDYNGVCLEGEAQYRITIHPGISVQTQTFASEIQKLNRTTYVLVALGDDDINIQTAVNLRMQFARLGIQPIIQAVVTDAQQKKALQGIHNYRGQAYNIECIGDVESCYAEKVIMDSSLEAEALRRHLKWGKEEEFWSYEYNYRSSVASAIHMHARVACGIPGADKKESELTEQERRNIEVLEHRRWNAYMRSEGYIYSGSQDKASRNDLAKMHNTLVDYASLSREDQRKNSRVGTG